MLPRLLMILPLLITLKLLPTRHTIQLILPHTLLLLLFRHVILQLTVNLRPLGLLIRPRSLRLQSRHFRLFHPFFLSLFLHLNTPLHLHINHSLIPLLNKLRQPPHRLDILPPRSFPNLLILLLHQPPRLPIRPTHHIILISPNKIHNRHKP
ncbi:hypothetical protein HanRHA438_Chr16g0741271 [Helianthus annuus]|nr:hypothetical protein HanRHA438_Chr16g0741271 [Helianthus annuus]